jgi:glycine/sarcosine N-methyltransferase
LAFYTDLSGVYDALFPVSDAQRSLFIDLLGAMRVRRVVDAGCGTGAQLLEFASRGASCTGFDPDPALVALARQKLASYPDVRIEIGGFADMTRLAGPAAGLVLCLGNSLVHVSQEEAARFIGDVAGILVPGGSLLVQILNYDRLHRGRVTELPPMEAGEGRITFRRRYVWEGPRKVRFRTELSVAGGGGTKRVRGEIPLFPVYPDELRDMLAGAGFTSVERFGDFARSEFTNHSEALVCLARKS